LIEGQDFTSILAESIGGRPKKEYVLSIDTAKHLSMMEKSSKGWEIRQYFIDVENRARQLSFPTGSNLLALAVLEAQKQLEQKDALILAQKPAVDFYKAVTGSRDTIDLNQVAKVLGVLGPNKLREFLRENGVLMANNNPYQKYIDLGWFRMVESSWTEPNGDKHVYLKTVAFQKGVDGIRKLLEVKK